MNSNEIITLQFGNYSNHIGAHWWNIQEGSFVYDSDKQPEINYDVLFREGENFKNEVTYTPRVLLTEVRGGLGGFPLYSDLYDDVSISEISGDAVLWDPDKIQIVREDEYEQNEFLHDLTKQENEMKVDEQPASIDKFIRKYELDDKVKYWSDYLSAKFHPRSVTVINKYRHNDNENSFCTFPQGVDLWNTELFVEDWTDKCRAYAEECNYLQGFHMLYDCNDGFSGLSSSALTYLQDEFASKSVFAFPSIPSSFSETDLEQNSMRIINTVMSFADLPELSSAFVPLCTDVDGLGDSQMPRDFDNLLYNSKLWYHSSAILASFLDSISMGYRSRKNITHMSSFLSRINACGRKLLTGTVRLPFPVYAGSSILECFEKLENPFGTSLTPKTNVTLESAALQEFNIRGLSPFSLLPSLEKRTSNPAYSCQSINELFAMYLNFCSSTSSANNSVINSFDSPLKIPDSFPNIFSENITRIGCVSDVAMPLKIAVVETPVLAGLHNCASASLLLTHLAEKASKIKLNTMKQFVKIGFEQLEYSEAIEKLLTLNDNYI